MKKEILDRMTVEQVVEEYCKVDINTYEGICESEDIMVYLLDERNVSEEDIDEMISDYCDSHRD